MSSSLFQKFRNVGRLTSIVNIFARYGFKREIQRTELGDLLGGSSESNDSPCTENLGYNRAQRLVMAFEELGPTFVKLGQMLSNREDLLPKNYVDELKRLQDNVKPFVKEQVDKILQQELSQSQRDQIEYFEYEPVGSASIGQVHRARLKDGRDVVFKIQRPDIVTVINNDLSILMGLASVLQIALPELKLIAPKTIVEELEKSLYLELDYQREAFNTDRMRQFFIGHKNIYIPEVYHEFSSSKILCLENVCGRKLTTLSIDQAFHHLVKIGVEAFLDMTFQYGLFHADLHPGNFILMNSGKLAILDFGLTAKLSRQTRQTMTYMFLAMSKNDVESCAHFFIELTHLYDESLREDLESEIEDILDLAISMPSKDIQLGRLLMKIAKVSASKQAPVARELILFFKALIALENFGRSLDPQFQILKLAFDYANERSLSSFNKEWFKQNSTIILRDSEVLMRELPFTIRSIIKRIQSGSLGFQMKSEELFQLSREIDRFSSRLSLSILLGSIILGSSIATYGKQDKLYDSIATLGMIGFGVAILLALGLVIEILRSGRF
ncbi:MAG: hypothetical protein K2X39_03320, partial [Silvanigrellaceae bacterium]|nr:hypothetical protein [Silvanigrellaceae bacterium]